MAALMAIYLGACASVPPPAKVQPLSSVLHVADHDLEQHQLLDIVLAVFDPGISNDRLEQQRNPVYPGVRHAESRFIPYVLRKTLERSGQWGAVRVLPQSDPSAELLVTGTILRSNGVELRLHISARDASGHKWLDRIYSDTAGWGYYEKPPGYSTDPFLNLYNSIANDLNAVRATLTEHDLNRIIDISQLRYAAALSPSAFADFLLEQPDGSVQLRRLPARDDPMLARVERLRQSEYLFIDTVDEQYASFYRSMGPTYSLWRRYSYGQTMELEELRQTQQQGQRGFSGMKQAYDNYKEGKIQQQALKELAESFNTEVDPTAMELQGQMVHLQGSLQSQYTEWRRLLRAIYAEETGMETENH